MGTHLHNIRFPVSLTIEQLKYRAREKTNRMLQTSIYLFIRRLTAFDLEI